MTTEINITIDVQRSVADSQYRLNVYTASGTIRPNIKPAIYLEVAKQHGDILRALNSRKWMTVDEICELVWRYERKMLHPSNRSKPSIVAALDALVDRSFAVKR
jgi:hypothetical protein